MFSSQILIYSKFNILDKSPLALWEKHRVLCNIRIKSTYTFRFLRLMSKIYLQQIINYNSIKRVAYLLLRVLCRAVDPVPHRSAFIFPPEKFKIKTEKMQGNW